MNIEIIDNIFNSYFDKNYFKTFNLIEEYLCKKNLGIYENLLEIYIDCQIHLGYYEEASKNLLIMGKMFPNYFSDYDMAKLYAKCNDIEKLKQILYSNNFSSREYNNIAVICYFNHNYKIAYEIYNYIISLNNDSNEVERSNDYIKKIKIYQNNPHVFKPSFYSFFKKKGNKLEPGHIVYIEKIRDKYIENQLNTDPKIERRPYMIWRIIDNKIYALAISTQIKNNRAGIISKKNHLGYNIDRVVKDRLVCIEEQDIREVIDKVETKEYNEIIKGIYSSICLNHDQSKKNTNIFMKTLLSELKINIYDIIIVPDFKTNTKKFYLILEYDKNKHKYKTIELNKINYNCFDIASNQCITISEKVSILNTITLPKEKLNELLIKIPDNFKGTNMLGKVVEYNSKKLEIMIEEKEYYICLDITLNYSPSFINIEFISKDIPLKIINEIENSRYQQQLVDLKHYITTNCSNYGKKKHSFKKKYDILK